MGLLDAFRDNQFWSDVADNTAQLGKAASDAVASNVTGPVDMAAWALRKAGLPIPAAPVGGSDWAKSMGLLNGPQPTQSAQIAGETLGLLAPTMIAAKAPQIASGLLQVGENAAAPRMMNPQTGAIVWHGSPHKFDKFDSSKIGTGEGAQAYGHGLYLAESPAVADEYAGKLSKKFVSIDEFKPSAQEQIIFDRLSARANGMQYKSGGSAVWDDLQSIIRHGTDAEKAAAKNIENNAGFLGRNLRITDQGSLYKVDLPDEHIAKMLDWDKPMTMQSDLYKQVAKEKELPYRGNTPKGGMDIYNSLVDQFGSQQAATEFLQKQGIPGIRYLDGGSRGAGSGTSNFVVFPGNEGLLQILERNGKKIGK